MMGFLTKFRADFEAISPRRSGCRGGASASSMHGGRVTQAAPRSAIRSSSGSWPPSSPSSPIFTMTRRNPVTAVMSLVATFFGLAALYATLSAHFLAVLQVLVYAGAIMVLFIFVVMILNREESTPISLRRLRVLGVLAAVYLFGSSSASCRSSMPTAVPPPAADTFGTVAADRRHPVPRVPVPVRGHLAAAAGGHRGRRGRFALAPERGRRRPGRRRSASRSTDGAPRLPRAGDAAGTRRPRTRAVTTACRPSTTWSSRSRCS